MLIGEAGFLVSHLCKRLLGENCNVICVDDFTTGWINPHWLSRYNWPEESSTRGIKPKKNYIYKKFL